MTIETFLPAPPLRNLFIFPWSSVLWGTVYETLHLSASSSYVIVLFNCMGPSTLKVNCPLDERGKHFLLFAQYYLQSFGIHVYNELKPCGHVYISSTAMHFKQILAHPLPSQTNVGYSPWNNSSRLFCSFPSLSLI